MKSPLGWRITITCRISLNFLLQQFLKFGYTSSYPGEGNGNPLQYSCLGNSVDKEAWRAQSMGSQESSATERPTLSSYIFYNFKLP